MNPNESEALFGNAMLCIQHGNGAQAEGFVNRLIRIQPQHDRAHFLLANAFVLQGRLLDALVSIERSLELRPQEPDYIHAKAQLLSRLNRSSESIEWYKRAIQLRPTPDAAFELSDTLMSEGQVPEATALLEQLAKQLPPDRFPHELLARAYTEGQMFERAEEHWRKAEQQATRHEVLVLERVTSEIYAGRFDVAESLIREILQGHPNSPQVYLPLISIKRVTEKDSALIEEMERLRKVAGIEPSQDRDLCYALGKAYNDLGEFRLAIDNYDEANRLAFELSPIAKQFDAASWHAYIDFLIDFFTKDRIRSLAREGLQARNPLFIVGMIRSGTTLVEQILSCHSRIDSGGETTFWPDHRGEILDARHRSYTGATGRRLGQTYLRMLIKPGSKAHYVTEKNPSNVFISALLHCVFPNATFVHIKRRPVDNLLSIWMTPIRTGLPFVHHRENLVSAYRDYLRIVDHLENTLPEERFRTFKYEDITSSPLDAIGGMSNFLGLGPEEACLHPERNTRTVRTPSFHQARQPINTDSQSKWKRYEPYLGAFARLLDD